MMISEWAKPRPKLNTASNDQSRKTNTRNGHAGLTDNQFERGSMGAVTRFSKQNAHAGAVPGCGTMAVPRGGGGSDPAPFGL
jgi:hypothetical protein